MKTFCVIAIPVLLLLLAIPEGLDSCAISGPDPVFVARHRPAGIKAFVDGSVGVVQAATRRIYLLGAYRMFSGVKWSPEDAKALYPPPAPANPTQTIPPEPSEQWSKARALVPGAPSIGYLSTYRSISRPDSYISYENCLDDSFVNAIHTLQDRIKRWGAADPRTKEWLAAQDQVFSNCAGDKPSIPPAVASGADPLLAADRAYQIAAAHFYAGEWSAARDGFEAIGHDSASPWHGIAPYLAARTSLREALVDNQPAALDDAERRFNAILKDASRKSWQEPSRKMLDLIAGRKDPAQRLDQLGKELMQPDIPDGARETADDFVYLFSTHSEKGIPKGSGDLAEWIEKIETPGGNEPVSRWRQSHNPAWLVAALIAPGDADTPELIQAAHQVAPGSPAYDSVVYYGIEREVRSGHRDEARAWADEVLKQNLPLSSRNLIQTQRLWLATNWNDFLRHAPRTPEPHLVAYDDYEEDTDKPLWSGPILEPETIAAFNRTLPQSLWIDASQNPLLPERIQSEIGRAAWIRAVILGRDAEARSLLERVAKTEPALRPLLVSQNPQEARYSALLFLLRSPDAIPHVSPSTAEEWGRPSTLGAGRWGFGENCFGRADDQAPSAQFLTPEQKKENEAELQKLAEIAPSGANYMLTEAMAWAKAAPSDPRVPEALHLAIQASRRGCTNSDTGRYSKQAFDLLHRQYPQSPWAAKTRYWYK